MNDAKRMAQLWTERAEGKQHLWFDDVEGEWGKWGCNDTFYQHITYKLKPEPKTLEDAARNIAAIWLSKESRAIAVDSAIKGAKWAWANPESKDERD